MTSRKFSPIELNHLRQFGTPQLDPSIIGEQPVEYATGHAMFRQLDFIVNSCVLIPRLESEEIIDLALQHISSQSLSHPFIADIGTGSGCLGISLASSLIKSNHPFTLFLSDISTDSLLVARENASRLLTSTTNIFFEQSDLFDNYPSVQFDVILANLPYIPSSLIPGLHPSVKDYEPLTALDGGPTGTTVINRLLNSLPPFLTPSGVAILEVNDTHTTKDFSKLPELSLTLEKDQFNHNRFLIVTKQSNL